MIGLLVLHIRPVRDVERLVDGEAPLIRVVADTALVSLCPHVVAIKGVAV